MATPTVLHPANRWDIIGIRLMASMDHRMTLIATPVTLAMWLKILLVRFSKHSITSYCLAHILEISLVAALFFMLMKMTMDLTQLPVVLSDVFRAMNLKFKILN